MILLFIIVENDKGYGGLITGRHPQGRAVQLQGARAEREGAADTPEAVPRQ